MTSLKKKRQQIDAIDARLLLLLNRRSHIVDQIKLIKRKQNLKVYDPMRETEIIKKLISINQGPLTTAEIKKLFKQLLFFFRQRQQRTQRRPSSKGRQKRL